MKNSTSKNDLTGTKTSMKLVQFCVAMLLTAVFLPLLSCASLSPPLPKEPVLSAQPESAGRDWIVCLGDSGVAGYGSTYPNEQGFPGLMDQYFYFRGINYQVYNAGINGDTTLGILARLDEYLVPKTNLIILRVGGNDLRQGVSVENIKQNIRTIVLRIQAANISTVLVQGSDFPGDIEFGGVTLASVALNQMYLDLGKELSIPVFTYYASSMGLPFQYLNQENLHLNRFGQREVARRLLPWLNPAWQTTEDEMTVTDDMVRYSKIQSYLQTKTESYTDAQKTWPEKTAANDE